MLGKRGHGLQLGPGFFFGGLLALVSGAVPFAPALVVALVLAVTVGQGHQQAFEILSAAACLAWWVFIVRRGYGWHLLIMLVVFGIAFAIVRCIN